jgi:hypothetical protein
MTPAEAEWQFDGSGLAFRSYLRVALTEHPFSRMARLYDLIAQTDRFWQLRHMMGVNIPAFSQWLATTQPTGRGAGTRHSPRWRQHGAWSAKTWGADYINHTVRIEAVEGDLAPVLAQLGIAPCLDDIVSRTGERETWHARYDKDAIAIMMARYGWDMAKFGYTAPRHAQFA